MLSTGLIDCQATSQQTAFNSAKVVEGVTALQLSAIIVYLVNRAKETAISPTQGEYYLSKKAVNKIAWFDDVYKDLTTIGGAETQVDFLIAFPAGATRASADSTKITIVDFVEAARFIEHKPTSSYCGSDAPASDVLPISLCAVDAKAKLQKLCHCWGAGDGEETSTIEEQDEKAAPGLLQKHLLAALKYREDDLQWQQGKIPEGTLDSAPITRMQSRFCLNAQAVLPKDSKWHTTFPLQNLGVARDLFGKNLYEAKSSGPVQGVARDSFGMFLYENKSSGLARDFLGRGVYEEQRSGVALDLFGVNLQQARQSSGVALDVFGVSIYDSKSSGAALNLWGVYLREAKEALKAVQRAEQVKHREEANKTLAFLQSEDNTIITNTLNQK